MPYALNATTLSTVPLCGLVLVHQLIDESGTTPTSQDDLITRLILEASVEMTRYLGFHTLRQSYVDQYVVPFNRKMFTLDARPVTSITHVKYAKRSSSIATSTAWTADDYILHQEAGWIQPLKNLTYTHGIFEVSYTGGLATTAGTVETDYPEIAGACARQVKYYMSRSNALAGNVSTIPGASATNNREYGLLFSVKETLDSYRRGTM